MIPESHPLDFDWRYDQETVSRICEIATRYKSVLLLGTPSIARRLACLSHPYTLVDRQPFQFSNNHVVMDISLDSPLMEKFSAAILDPPWYPGDLRLWLAYACLLVEQNGSIYATIWPPDTRPTAQSEYNDLISWAKTWSHVEVMPLKPTYEVPCFEENVGSIFDRDRIYSTSPRYGLLLHFQVLGMPNFAQVYQANKPKERWQRFLFNNYQIGVRVKDDAEGSTTIQKIPGASGWNWPFVSRRAPNRSLIDVWSSRNEVGSAQRTSRILSALRDCASSSNATAFEEALSGAHELLEWQLPRPPYWRICEWSHRQ